MAHEVEAEPDVNPNQIIKGDTFSQQTDILYSNLKKIPRPLLHDIFEEYEVIVAKELDMERLFFTQYQELTHLLDLAVKESVDVLTLFTLPVLQQKNSNAIVLDRESLMKLNKQYNLHGLFLILKDSADDDSIVGMNFLITGQGKLIIGYDKNMTIRHPDYYFATGRYDYQKLFVMDAKTDSQGNYGIFNIKGLANPTADFQWMKGPLNVDIKSLSLIPGSSNEKNILVQYDLFGSRNKIITRIPIEKLVTEN